MEGAEAVFCSFLRTGYLLTTEKALIISAFLMSFKCGPWNVNLLNVSLIKKCKLCVCICNKERDHRGSPEGHGLRRPMWPSCHLRLLEDLAKHRPRVGTTLKETRALEFFRMDHKRATYLSQVRITPSVTLPRLCRTERTQLALLRKAELKFQQHSGVLSPPTCAAWPTHPPPQI